MQLENKTLTLAKPKKEDEEESFFTYGDLITYACGQSPTPVSLLEQRIRFKLIDAVESAPNGEIEIDEKHLEVLKKCIESIAVSPISKEFVQFLDDIDNLKPEPNGK